MAAAAAARQQHSVGSVGAPALRQRDGSGNSFAAVWQPAWRQRRQLCGSVALAVAVAAVQGEKRRQRGSGGGDGVAGAVSPSVLDPLVVA